MSEFKELENVAKGKYLDDLTNLLDPKKPQQFWNVIAKMKSNRPYNQSKNKMVLLPYRTKKSSRK